MIVVDRVPADVDEATFTEIGSFLVIQAKELVPAPVDMNTAMTRGYQAISEGMTMIARDDDGPIVGSLALRETELAWCADPARRCLVDFWFVIAPEWRGKGVRQALEAGAVQIGEERKVPVFIFRRHRIR